MAADVFWGGKNHHQAKQNPIYAGVISARLSIQPVCFVSLSVKLCVVYMAYSNLDLKKKINFRNDMTVFGLQQSEINFTGK